MPTIKKFDFERSRGVVWVCDLSESSSYLNDDVSAKPLEEFLPRLHWTAVMAVESAGGRFIKWTGDGFLAWFETSFHRDTGKIASAVFEAAWHLTFLVNVTQLGLSPERKFRIRHGITYEHDALLLKIRHTDGHESLDIIGRAVVLAFRISGFRAPFPNIVTHRELVDASAPHDRIQLAFRRKRITKEEKQTFLKGQDWQTKHLYASIDTRIKLVRTTAIIKKAEEVIALAEGPLRPGDEESFSVQFIRNMLGGPRWCRDVISEHTRFLREGPLALARLVLSSLRGPGYAESVPRSKQPTE